MLALLALSVILASLYSVVLHRADLRQRGSVFLFNLLCSAVWLVCLLLANGCRLRLDSTVLLWGVAYGITQALFILCKAKAMNSGAVSLTTMVGNCSVLLSVLFCFILWGEPISPADIVGLGVLLLGILLITYKRGSAHVTRGWAIYSLLFLIFGAAIGLVFKAFSKSGSGRAGDMMIVACIVMLVSYTVICLVCGGQLSRLPAMIRSPKSGFLPVALIAGVLSCTYNRLNIFLSGELIGAVFFPCFNGGVVILSTVLGVLLLREKLNGVQLLGTALGVAGICVIGIF